MSIFVFFCFLLPPLRHWFCGPSGMAVPTAVTRQSVSLRKGDRFAPSSASFFLLAQKETKDAPGFGSEGAFQLLFAKRPNPDYYGRAELRCLRLLSAARRFACAFVYGRHALLCLVKMFLPPQRASAQVCRGADVLGKKKIHPYPTAKAVSAYEGFCVGTDVLGRPKRADDIRPYGFLTAIPPLLRR
ncbi:MAG: hypothetical protein IIV78_04785 [Oscillospiraceae bacterium]|nr:hypothetical protein [Oscillospiraceae bacterium]